MGPTPLLRLHTVGKSKHVLTCHRVAHCIANNYNVSRSDAFAPGARVPSLSIEDLGWPCGCRYNPDRLETTSGNTLLSGSKESKQNTNDWEGTSDHVCDEGNVNEPLQVEANVGRESKDGRWMKRVLYLCAEVNRLLPTRCPIAKC